MPRLIWPLPVSAAGLLLALLIRIGNGRLAWNGGTLEASDGISARVLWLLNPWGRIEAITLGHVILARDGETMKRLRAHENVHVRQYERWGVLFPFAYLMASAIAGLGGGCPYRDNVFEIEAFKANR